MSSMTTKIMRIPDPNEPQREPDGQVGEFYFWLGDEAFSEEDDDDFSTSDMGDVDEPTLDFGTDEGIER